MNAIDLLTKEHDKFRETLNEISEPSHRFETKVKMFHNFSQVLIRHEDMEHKVWYPHFKHKLDDTVQHLLTEEKNAEKAIKQFENIKTAEAWEEKFAKFKNDVGHHADEEEQKLFPKVEKILSQEELDEIGKKMYVFKRAHPTH